MTHKPTDQLLESLSALVDNETSELELRRILKHIGADETMREQWRRHHIIGSALRRERDVSSGGGIAEAVMAAIAEDQTAVAPPKSSSDSETASARRSNSEQSWKNWIGKSAVAASFAAVMVLGFNAMDSGSPLLDQPALADAGVDQSVELGTNRVVASAPLGFDIPVPGSRTVASGFNGAPQSGDARARAVAQSSDDLTDPATQAFLNYLLIEHVERASVNGNLGLLPFARVSKMTESN